MSIADAHAVAEPSQLADLTNRRPDVDPRELVPVDADGLRTLVRTHVDAGLSKFVLRLTAVGDSWASEAAWLADAVLDLQT